jgi:dihydroorotase
MQAMRYAKTFDLPLWLRPVEDTLAGSGVAAAGAVAGRLGLPSIPVVAETVALHTIFELQAATGARIHLCRLSSAAGIELVRRAKRDGLAVTCDVSSHHVHLTDVDIGYFDANFRLDPPLRSGRDRDGIVGGLADGTIDAICSDHAPIGADDKLLPFGEAEPGASGLETLLPLVLKWAANATVPLGAALAKVTSSAARILGEDTGTLKVGAASSAECPYSWRRCAWPRCCCMCSAASRSCWPGFRCLRSRGAIASSLLGRAGWCGCAARGFVSAACRLRRRPRPPESRRASRGG